MSQKKAQKRPVRPPSYARPNFYKNQHVEVSALMKHRRPSFESNPFNLEVWESICLSFARMFEKDNIGFKRDEFLESCGFPAKKD